MGKYKEITLLEVGSMGKRRRGTKVCVPQAPETDTRKEKERVAEDNVELLQFHCEAHNSVWLENMKMERARCECPDWFNFDATYIYCFVFSLMP